MGATIREVVVVGGGTAGWIAASLIAARRDAGSPDAVRVTLIESPEMPTIGVGEGTWPTMRRTLERIGIDEADFLIACDASFKQGSRFDGWVTGAAGDSYLHPFAPPVAGAADDVLAAWREADGSVFAEAVTPQARVCALGLAPKQQGMPGFAGALNYGYHLDAVKLAGVLARHATTVLGVRHVRDHVVGIDSSADGDIAAVRTREHGAVAGDLFIDCTGHASLLLGEHFGIGFVDRSDVLFNDRALAVQVPVATPDAPIASQTISTAHAAGWIWDIGLPTRRGVGCVYSSRHMDDDAAAATLRAHVRATSPDVDADALSYRQLAFRSGHRERFWQRNCVGVGLSAGFLEPLEASAIVLIELSVEALIADFPANRGVMDIQARRFNALFRYRWDRIIDFLKLHYVLSRREGAYWDDHRAAESIPESLRELLAMWRYRAPTPDDLGAVAEIFPAASYQYILYGMGFATAGRGAMRRDGDDEVRRQMKLVEQRARTLAAGLPGNRALIDALRAGRAGVAATMGNDC